MSRVFAYRVQGFRAICDGIVKVQGLAAHFNPEKHETHQHSQAHTCAFDQKQRRAIAYVRFIEECTSALLTQFRKEDESRQNTTKCNYIVFR